MNSLSPEHPGSTHCPSAIGRLYAIPPQVVLDGCPLALINEIPTAIAERLANLVDELEEAAVQAPSLFWSICVHGKIRTAEEIGDWDLLDSSMRPP